MRAIKVYCPPGVEPPLYAFIDALDGKLKAIEDFIIPFTCSPAMKQARGSFRSWLFRTTA